MGRAVPTGGGGAARPATDGFQNLVRGTRAAGNAPGVHITPPPAVAGRPLPVLGPQLNQLAEMTPVQAKAMAPIMAARHERESAGVLNQARRDNTLALDSAATAAQTAVAGDTYQRQVQLAGQVAGLSQQSQEVTYASALQANQITQQGTVDAGYSNYRGQRGAADTTFQGAGVTAEMQYAMQMQNAARQHQITVRANQFRQMSTMVQTVGGGLAKQLEALGSASRF